MLRLSLIFFANTAVVFRGGSSSLLRVAGGSLIFQQACQADISNGCAKLNVFYNLLFSS